MQKFRFRLERVHELWTRQADLEEMRLKQLFSQLHALEEERQRLVRELAAAETALRQARQVESWELEAMSGFRRYTEQCQRGNAQRQAECKAAIQRQQQAVMEARRRTRLMDKLKERKLAAWQQELARELETTAAESFLARLVRERPA
jgi:hypothetical protein